MEITSTQLPQLSQIQIAHREMRKYIQPGVEFIKSDHWSLRLRRLLEICLVW